MPRPALIKQLVITISLISSLQAAPLFREAPNQTATPANQLVVSGNACGPAALLNAFRFGSENWQSVAKSLQGETDKGRLLTIIRGYGLRPSAGLKGRLRWTRHGVNIADLQDIANEMAAGKFLPEISQQVLFRQGGETQEKLLTRVHRQLETSLAKGFPPVLSLRRHVLRAQNERADWVVLDAHFVTVTRVTRKLHKDDRFFVVHYIDPWGGKSCEGRIRIPDQALLAASAKSSPCLLADFPAADVGRKRLRSGEKSSLAAAAVLGRW